MPAAWQSVIFFRIVNCVILYLLFARNEQYLKDRGTKIGCRNPLGQELIYGFLLRIFTHLQLNSKIRGRKSKWPLLPSDGNLYDNPDRLRSGIIL